MLRAVSGALVGKSPRRLACLLVPTGLAVGMDAVLRGGTLIGYATQAKAIYGSSLLISAALWALPLWAVDRLVRARRPAGPAVAACLVAGLFVFATMSFGGQALYHHVFHSYMGRDTLRLGIALRGTVTDWFEAWGTGGLLAGMCAIGALVVGVTLGLARAVGPASGGRVSLIVLLTFPAAIGCLWFDQLDSRFLQAATPDTCFAHGVVHAVRMRVEGTDGVRKGMSVRAPEPLPPFAPSPGASEVRTRPNVLVILLESVRADALCSDPPPACAAPFLDEVAATRIPLGKLTTEAPNTFSAFLILTTGLAPNVDFASAHAAPLLWELARRAGYHTAYVSAQNPKYEDFGTFVQRAGIDTRLTGTELGGMEQEQIGAPDERAAAAMLDVLRASVTRGDAARYFALLHLSNTHAPYRVADDLLPFQPSSGSGLGDVTSFHNRYRNGVRLEERTVSRFLRQLEALPGWDDTVVVLLSDHGEQFHEHGGYFHNHSLYDEELRVPGFLLAGNHALSEDQRRALATYAGKRTYTQDVHATLTDLLGAYDTRASLPRATLVSGRSMLRPRPDEEPAMLLATSTAVWEPDDARYGAMQGRMALVSSPERAWVCFDTVSDPEESDPRPPEACGGLLGLVRRSFTGPDVPR